MKYYDINNNYKKGRNRINYSYRNELGEQYNLMDAYSNNNIGYTTKLNNNIEVFSNCFDTDCKTLRGLTKYNKHKLIGNTQFMPDNENDIYVDGNSISNVGFIKYPENSINTNKNLIDVINSRYIIESKNIFDNIDVNILKNDFSIGDKIKVCLDKKVNITGEIIDIRETKYIISPDESDDITDNLNIDIKDKNIEIAKIENITDINNSCFIDNINKHSIFLYNKDELDKDNLEQLLSVMVPNNKSIINNIISDELKSVKEINYLLEKYNISIDDFTFNNFEKIKEILNNNNNTKKSFKLKKELAIDYNKKEKRENFSIVKNYILDQLVQYYGEYPFFNSKLDSDIMRLKWIENKPDNGKLFFKYFMKDLNKKYLETKDQKIKSIQKFISKLENDNNRLLDNLDREFSKIKESRTEKCVNLRLVKIYTTIEELQLDNNRQIFIDDDKLLEGEINNKVKINQYAILIENELQKKIYKRISLSNGNDIWSLERDIKLDTIINSYKDFCNQQGLSIEEMDLDFFKGTNKCKYSEFYKACLPVRLIKMKEKIDKNDLSIKENKINIDNLIDSTNYLDKLENEINQIQYLLNLESDKTQLIKLNKEKEISNYKASEADDLYEDLYNNIDKYLENINEYSKYEYYMALDKLITKYGRKASTVESEAENPKNIYCRLGKKVIICSHHQQFIDYHKNIKTLEEATKILTEKFGIETEGTIWCNNCGEEISLSEYETLGDFVKSGARDTTNEIIDLSDEYESKENNETVELLRKVLLEGDVKSVAKDNTLNVVKIINFLLSIIGVTLTQNDKLRVISSCELLSKNNIKNKTEWIRVAQKKKEIYHNRY